MQHQHTGPYPYQQQAVYQDGNGQWIPTSDTAKGHQYHQNHQNHWESNSFHVTGGNNYGPGQVPGGGGQTRVGVGPQQPQQPSQPTPTNTPPGMHGDMTKQPLQPATQMSFVQTRQINPLQMAFARGAMPQSQPMRNHGRPVAFNMPTIGQVLSSPQTQTIVHQPYLMYSQGRQAPPFANQAVYMPQQPYFSAHPNSAYYQPVIQQGFPNLSSGGPSPQATTPQPPVAMLRPNLGDAPTPQPPPAKQEFKKRAHAIRIIDPTTNEEVKVDDSGANNNNVTPTRSNDSSARETPQPGAGSSVSLMDNTVAAEFAAKVAACAMDTQPQAPSPAPDTVPLDSVSDSDTLHKQPPVVPISERLSSTLSTASVEFVPRSLIQGPLPIEVPVEQMQPLLEFRPPAEVVPTVSAETDSPPVDIQRPPLVTKNTTMPSNLAAQSPLRTTKKQKGGENERQQAAAMPPPPQPQVEVRDNKKGPKSVQREEPVSMPKERREKRPALIEQSLAPNPVIAPDVAPNIAVAVPQTESIEEKSQVVEDPMSQHQNGETVEHEPPPTPVPVSANVPVVADSNKTANKRQSGKKAGKMKDLNRRGTEKEGSEMDAFTTEPTIMSEEKERPPTPVSTPPSSPPPAVPEHVDKIQEDLEEKEDKLVAAKNEENAKVSALNRPEPEPSPVEEDKQPPQLTLKHSYSKDQWSPLNPDGKKKYDRDFLYLLRTEPLCTKKPDNLPDVVMGMFKDFSNNKNRNLMNNRTDNMAFISPSFMHSSQSQRGGGGGMAPKRGGSQQGSKKGSRVIQISLSLNEDVKLKTSENAWKPANRVEGDIGKTEFEKQTAELLKNVRGILNKLTPQKFDKLMHKFMNLPINTELRLKEVIDLIFDKAVDEPSFSNAYAKMCKICSKLEVNKPSEVNKPTGPNPEDKVNFRKMLITRCQIEFEKNKAAELDAEKWHEEINACSEPDKRKEKQLAYEEKERGIRMKSVGNIRFIGELFKLGMLTPAIMYRCIDHLLSTPAEESLECLCKLLSTIGKDLEFGNNNANKQVQPGSQGALNPYFQRMSDISSNKKGHSKVSSRVRFMIQDVIELRQNKWVPRREDNNPKTIEQINKEAERESMEASLALNQSAPRMNRQNDRPDDRKQRNRGNQNDPDGWNTVTSNSRFHHTKFSTTTAFESSKMQNIKQEDLNSLSLGGSSMFRGFNVGAKSAEPKTGTTFTSSNAFSALQPRGEERKPPPNMNNRKMTPTPSIEREKERQRMLHGAKENDGRSSRESSAQRERPQPPSRDSSVTRQAPVETPAQPRRDDDKVPGLSEEDMRKTKEKLERQAQTLIEEYLGAVSSVKDIKQEVEELFSAHNCGDFVQKALEMSLEKKAPAHRNIGLLITAILDSNIFSPEVIVEQFGLIYEMSEDLAIDIPKIWEIQAQIIVPILAAEKINFSHFRDACGPVLKTTNAPALLVPVLSLLVSEKGEGFVRKVWDSSNVSLKDFLPEGVDVDTFVEEKSIKYLTGEAPKYEASLSMDDVQGNILRLIQNTQPFEKILDFINANVGDKVEGVSFIRALVAAFCEACITGPNNCALNLDKFKQYEKLLQRFVDNKEDRELACLSSVHILCSKLQHPQGLILSIFTEFLDDNLICSESFLKWKDDKHVTLENKGVSVFALASFFAALEEVETDDETS